MRKLVFAAVVGALVLASAPAALAGPNRADAYYTVHCIDPDGNPTVNESVDAHASSRAASSTRSPTSTTTTRAGPAGSRARLAASQPTQRAGPPSAAGPPAHLAKGRPLMHSIHTRRALALARLPGGEGGGGFR